MTLDDFTDLLDRCGADPAAWPPGAALSAERLLAWSDEARAELAALQRAEQALSRTRDGRVAGGVAARAMLGAQASPEPEGAAPWRWAAAAAVALSLGVATGVWRGHPEDPASAVILALSVPGESADAG